MDQIMFSARQLRLRNRLIHQDHPGAFIVQTDARSGSSNSAGRCPSPEWNLAVQWAAGIPPGSALGHKIVCSSRPNITAVR
jgi:hypothetical protein